MLTSEARFGTDPTMRKIDQHLGTKERTTFYTVVSVFISVSLICSVLFISLFNTQRSAAGAELRYIGSKYANVFADKINSALDYMSIIVKILELQVRNGYAYREELQNIVWEVFDSYPSVYASNIYFEPNMYDGRDAEYAGTDFGTGVSGRIAYYYYRMDGRTNYLPEVLGNDIEFTEPFYIDTKTQNAPIYTAPEVYEINGVNVLLFVISFPIRGPNNEFIGSVSVDIFLGDVYAQLQAESIYETGYIIIVNDKGQLVYSPRFEDIGKTLEEVGLAPLPQISDVSISFNAKSIIDDKDILIAIETIYFPQLDSRFYFSVAAPFGEINANGTHLIIIIVIFVAIVVVLIALALNYLIGKLLYPLIEFKDAANKITNRDYSVRITGEYKDEFAVLKFAVNSMIKSIDSYMEDSRKSLNVLENILNGIDAFIYVTVPETGRLLFINNQMKKAFKVEGDGSDQYCFKVFEGVDKICDYCPCHQLDKDPHKTVVWERFNEVYNIPIRHTDRYIDWPGGTKVHLQHAIDLTDIKTVTEEKVRAEHERTRAEESSRMKSVFLASMSHEIRTPMHGIIGFSELALDDNIPLKTRNYLSKIKTSAESLLLIINDILDVSKIEAGKMELEKIPFEMSEVFKLCRVISSPKAREKGLTLFCYSEPSIGRLLLGDPTRLRQILLNLLSNAIKFTNNGMVKLLSAITEKTENTISMHFEVKDSGIGMTPEQVNRIFEPFMQADDSTTRKYGGTGLGLSITKNFVELMGGELQVESTLGLGSRFSFNLTFETVDSAADHVNLPVTVNLDEKPIFDGEILVCEDNSLNQMVISDHLSKVGIKTIIAENGRIGVNAVKSRIDNGEKMFDLIFMDIHMPEMDGLDAAKRIIEMGVKKPIVALTANIMSNDRETYLVSGMCDCLPKPFVAHELWSCLLKYLKPVSMLTIKKDDEYVEEDDQRMELINAFVKSNQTTFKDINDALEAGDAKLAHRLAHTLKGVAGLVGMNALSQAAMIVEQSLATGKMELLNDQMSMLEKELNAALDELAQVINHAGKNTKPAVDGSFDKKKALELLETLDSLLESDSFDSVNLVDDLNSIPGTEQLASQVENLKFKQARQTLASVKQQLENQA
jgi:signal transduction histidine kinase/DNA-binding response OmpR family regulator/HAMP domain-containing protein